MPRFSPITSRFHTITTTTIRSWTVNMNVATGGARTLTALKRWSCQDKQLPNVNKIRAIHIYDFDNTRTSTLCPPPLLHHCSMLIRTYSLC